MSHQGHQISAQPKSPGQLLLTPKDRRTKHLEFSGASASVPPALRSPCPSFVSSQRLLPFTHPHPTSCPPTPHLLSSFSLLFYLNLPQICPSTKQLPSLFSAIMCGSTARVGPPGRQSPANRVSVSYCGVCPGRSITRHLTPGTGSHGKPAGPLLESPPLCPSTHRSGTKDGGLRGATGAFWFFACI